MHHPEFMSVAPWYLSTGGGPSLKHQKVGPLSRTRCAALTLSPSHHAQAPVYNADPNKLQERFDRGVKAVSVHAAPSTSAEPSLT